MYELLKDVDKKALYEAYSRIIDEPKDIRKVNIKKMIDEIIEYYSDYNNILKICSYSEIRYLYKIVNKELEHKEILTDRNFEDLKSKLLIVYTPKITIPKELVKPIKDAYKNMNKEKMEQVETLDVILIGIFKIYGLLTYQQLFTILSNYIVYDEKELEEYLGRDKYFKFYVNKIKYKKKDYYIYRAYEQLKDIIYAGVESFKDVDYCLRPFEEIIYLRFNLFNEMNKDILKLSEELNKIGFNDVETLLEISVDTVIDNDRKDLIKKLNKYGDEFIRVLNNAMDNMPSACLKGYTRKEYLDTIADKNYDKEYDKVRYDNNIIKYKEVREKTKVVMDEGMYFAFKEKLTDKFNDVVKKNDIYFTEGDTAIVSNLVLFHSINNEKTIFDIFFSKKVTIFFPYYDIFKQFKESYVEGLFNVTAVNKNEGFVVLKNQFSRRDYKVYDVALSNNKNILNNYIYTSLVTVDNYTFTTDYICVLGSDNKVLEKIDKIKKRFKGIDSDITKTYLACYEIFRDSNMNIKSRNLE